MLDAWIIEKIKEWEKEQKKEGERPILEVPVYDSEEHEDTTNKDSEPNIIKIQLGSIR